MTILPDMNELADRLFGTRRAETTKVSSNSETITLYGVATSDSEDGMVSVDMTDAVYLVDDENELIENDATTSIQMPTHVDVREGDEVAITLVGNSTAKAPVVSGVVGGGDRQQAEIDAAADAASAASAAASAAQQKADKAAQDIAQAEQEIADFKSNTYTKEQVNKKVDEGPDSLKSWITANYTNSQDLGTTYATKTLVSQTKEDIELSASQTYANKGAGNPNLSPFLAHDIADVYDATTNPDGYWAARPANTTMLSDGWGHVVMDNSGGSASYRYFTVAPLQDETVPTTILVEIRNLVTDAQGVPGNRLQLSSQNRRLSAFTTTTVTEDGSYYFPVGVNDATSQWFCTVRPYLTGGNTAEFDIRISAYASTEATIDGQAVTLPYEGSFKPYVTDQAALSKEYSTKAELRVGLDSITAEVSKAYESIDATTLAPFSDSVEGYLTSSAAGSATDPLHEPDARKERTSGHFDVTPGASYVFKGKAANESATDWMWRAWRFYDSAGKTLGSLQGGDVGQGADEFVVTFTAPEDAASCRVSMTCFEDGRWQVLGDLTKTTADLSSSIEQTAESIESTVSAQLSDVRILGENILRNVVKPEIAGQVIPDDYDGKWFGSSGNQGAIVSTVDVTDSPQAGVTRAFRIDNSAYTGNRDAAQRIPDGIKAGEQLAFSAWVRAVGSDCRAQVRVWNTAAPTGAKFTWSKVVGTTWERIVIPVTLSADTHAANLMMGINGRGIIEWIAPVLLQGVDADLLAADVEANYTKTSTFTQTVDGLTGRITATEDGLAVQETLIRQYAGGVLVCKVGENIGALVNASGSFDVVGVSWNVDEPTVTGTFSTFMQNIIELGKGNSSSEIKFCDDGVRIFYDSNQLGFNVNSSDRIILSSEGTSNQRAAIHGTVRDPNDPDPTHALRDGGMLVGGSGVSGSGSVSIYANEYDSSMTPIAAGHINVLSYGTRIDHTGFVQMYADGGVMIGHDVVNANVIDGTPIKGIFFGSVIKNPNSSTTMTLLTAAQCQSTFGRALDYTKDVVVVTNGDTAAYGGTITGGTNASGALMATISATKSGPIRYNYLVILGA